jgi:peptide/nickel transport system substrate-binding protein
MPAAGPIPQRYGQKYDSSKSSSYAQHVISTGPYYVSEYSPKTSITLKRNPNWSPSSDEVRKAYVDEIDIREGFDNSVCIQKVLNDEYDTWVTPGCAPIGAQLRKIVTTGDYSDRSFDGPQAATAYVFMNTTLKPFDNLDVRRAVEYAIDKQNLLKLQGGSYVGSIATSVLPPGILGFVSPRDFDPFATPHDRPDLSKAKALMEKAGYGDGYHRPLLVVGDSAQPIPGMLQSVKADLAKIGIDNLKIKTLPFPDWYTNYMQIPSRHVSLGISWWYEDFPSPTSFLTPLLYGPSIHAHGNNNFSLLDDPKLNDLIDKASGETGAAAERTWTKANKVATSLAPWVPYRWFLQPVTVSSRMQNAYYNQYYGTIDWINAGVQGGGS